VIFIIAFGASGEFFENVLGFLLFALGGAPLVDGIIPVDVAFGPTSILTLGTIVVFLGALLSFVSVFMKREDF
jgi:hypothetical protein